MRKTVALLLALALLTPLVIAQDTVAPLTNADIIRLVAAKIPPEVIVKKIESSPSRFDMEPSHLIELTQRGVPKVVMMAMMDARFGKGPEPKAERPASPPPTEAVLLEDGTDFMVTLQQEVSSKTAVSGDPVRFRVDEDVRVGGHVVIRRGAPVKGFVSASDDNGMMGKGGRVGVRIESVRAVDGQPVLLRAAKGKSEGTRTGMLVLNYVLFGPLGFLTRGKNAKIKEGTRVSVYVDEDKKIAVPVGK